jgi:hypothetical protein
MSVRLYFGQDHECWGMTVPIMCCAVRIGNQQDEQLSLYLVSEIVDPIFRFSVRYT